MLEEPDENQAENSTNPADRAREKADEFRIHAELAAVFEGTRKFDARITPGLDAGLAREVQRTIARLEKSRSVESPVIPHLSAPEAAALLQFNAAHGLSTNDYHVHRRPGETMIVRWLAGAEVEQFYGRLQAHFDTAIAGFREDERQAHEWKRDPGKLAYLAALDAIEMKMADRYLRDPIRKSGVYVLSTQTADEINIVYLSDYIMGVAPADLVGPASAPGDDPDERELAWFFKLFSLRGAVDGFERMCFFAFLQKTEDDSFDFAEDDS